MPAQLRIPLTILIALTPSACFDPSIDPGPGGDEGDESTSTGSATDPAASTTDPTSDGADSTGPLDAPPVITALTVDSSTMPPELQASGMVVFDVDANDDIGIDRIEIYDGDTLLTTVTEIPYRTEVLLTSADNGSHSYSAVAYDTAGQTDESEEVPLSVNIVGGAILELREDIAEAYLPVFLGYPRVVTDDTGNVFVTLTTPPDGLQRVHAHGLSYSSTLGLLWESTLNELGTSVYALAHPLVTAEDELLVGGILEAPVAEDNIMGVYRADASAGDPLSPQLFGNTDGHFVFSATTQLLNGDIVLAPEPNVLEARSPDFMSVSWSQEQFPALSSDSAGALGILGIDVDAAGNLLLTFVSSEPVCGENGLACIRKLSPDGTTLWTRPAAGLDSSLSFMPARFDRAGRAVTVWANGDDGVLASIYDPEGMLVNSFQVLQGIPLLSCDLALDPQGNLLVVGYLDEDVNKAWAARISPVGAVLWSQHYDELQPGEDGSLTGGVAVTEGGRAYLVGVSDLFVPGVLAFEGSAWVAEIGL